MRKIELVPCKKCKAVLRAYWLRNGICNGCRNPDLIVESITTKEK